MFSFAELDLMRCRLRWAYERPLPNTTTPQRYVHSPIAAWYVRRGKISVAYDDGEVVHCVPGEWVFPREGLGWQTFSEGLEILSIRFQATWAHGEPLFSRSHMIRFASEEAPALLDAATALVQAVRSGTGREDNWDSRELRSTPDAYWRVQQQFSRWLAEWYQALLAQGVALKHPAAVNPKVRQALEWMEALPPDAEVREGTLAARIGVSVSQLNKLFMAHTGATPAAHWQRRRLEIARNLLISGAESVKEIAFHLGFSTPEYFTTWFRKLEGAPPSVYRRRFRTSRDGAAHWV